MAVEAPAPGGIVEGGVEKGVCSDVDGECGAGAEEQHEFRFLNGHNRVKNPQLPETVTELRLDVTETMDGEREEEATVLKASRVYLVGTAHFSRESRRDVQQTVEATQPDVVMVELCASRTNVLALDEQTLLDEAQNLATVRMMETIRQSGLLQGIMHILLLSKSAHITKQLGMAPGGEFRAAFLAANEVPGCMTHLGDRPFGITIQRALAPLNLWQKFRLFRDIRFPRPRKTLSRTKISKEQVEAVMGKSRKKDIETPTHFPEVDYSLIQERDQFMAHRLRTLVTNVSAMKFRQALNDGQPWEPAVVVGVVGMSHVPGIRSNLNKDVDVAPLLRVPPPSRSAALLKYGLLGGALSLGVSSLYIAYRGIRWIRDHH